ncbi:hypothetical protein D3H55_16230 [Bacillus salacetis]|uniref:Uncharacterized protein n=1 Tax=Bacillus salacetis TaxID=2315464 RepID=A0A3A1QTC3_9BACI|nr:hypothetical protein D3H55_16230 [Bacillus salacetis]
MNTGGKIRHQGFSESNIICGNSLSQTIKKSCTDFIWKILSKAVRKELLILLKNNFPISIGIFRPFLFFRVQH